MRWDVRFPLFAKDECEEGEKRDHKIEDDDAWTRVRSSLTSELDEVKLVCELHATKGEASFDEGSLRLMRRKE